MSHKVMNVGEIGLKAQVRLLEQWESFIRQLTTPATFSTSKAIIIAINITNTWALVGF